MFQANHHNVSIIEPRATVLPDMMKQVKGSLYEVGWQFYDYETL
jgi:hypothetical protein